MTDAVRTETLTIPTSAANAVIEPQATSRHQPLTNFPSKSSLLTWDAVLPRLETLAKKCRGYCTVYNYTIDLYGKWKFYLAVLTGLFFVIPTILTFGFNKYAGEGWYDLLRLSMTIISWITWGLSYYINPDKEISISYEKIKEFAGCEKLILRQLTLDVASREHSAHFMDIMQSKYDGIVEHTGPLDKKAMRKFYQAQSELKVTELPDAVIDYISICIDNPSISDAKKNKKQKEVNSDINLSSIQLPAIQASSSSLSQLQSQSNSSTTIVLSEQALDFEMDRMKYQT